jgi:hypothetical protein
MLAHTMLARWIGPEMLIAEGEALELARAYLAWRQFYPGMLDPKTQALVNLAMVAGAMEGPRLMRAGARRSAERAARKQAEADAKGPAAPFGGPNIFPMGPPQRGA